MLRGKTSGCAESQFLLQLHIVCLQLHIVCLQLHIHCLQALLQLHRDTLIAVRPLRLLGYRVSSCAAVRLRELRLQLKVRFTLCIYVFTKPTAFS